MITEIKRITYAMKLIAFPETYAMISTVITAHKIMTSLLLQQKQPLHFLLIELKKTTTATKVLDATTKKSTATTPTI